MPRVVKASGSRRGQRPNTFPQFEMMKRQVSVWEHLRILSSHGYAEDTILLYEVTNQITSSTRWTVPDDPTQLHTFRQISELYIKTKRYAQAGAILKTLIDTFPAQRPFSYPAKKFDAPRLDGSKKSEAQIEYEDSVWHSYYITLQKTNKMRDAMDALEHLSSKTFKRIKSKEMPAVIRQMKNSDECDLVAPQQWKTELPDESSARICSSSLGPIMTLLKKKKADSVLIKKFANQFIGTERTNVFWWLKSFEAVGQQKIQEAIACLNKMTHQNPRVLTEMARLNYRIDKRDEARRLLKTAHSTDSLWCDGMDLLAFLCIGKYFKDFTQNSSLIQGLAHTLNIEWPHRIETYVVNGFMAHQLNLNLAWSYSNRAMKAAVPGTDQFVFAVHLRAYCLRTLEVKSRPPESDRYRIQLRAVLDSAIKQMPNSSDLGLLLVDTLLEDEDGHREAKIFATKFLHDNQDNVHAKLLKVHVLVNGVSRNPETNHTTELFRLLNEVIEEHPHILSAYCFLLNEYGRLKDNEKCKEILQKLTDARPLFPTTKTHRFHRLTADYLLKFRDVIPAYEHLMAAIATGSAVDQATMVNYEAEFASSSAVAGDYKNLAFLDSVLPERPTSSTADDAAASSPALQEVVNDHENEQDSSSGGDGGEESGNEDNDNAE